MKTNQVLAIVALIALYFSSPTDLLGQNTATVRKLVFEDTTRGSAGYDTVTLRAPQASQLTSSYSLTLPTNRPVLNSSMLVADTLGAMSWIAPGAANTFLISNNTGGLQWVPGQPAWLLGGNNTSAVGTYAGDGTATAGARLGSTTNHPLVLTANNLQVARFTPASNPAADAPQVTFGGTQNVASGIGATVLGGGSVTRGNLASGLYATTVGGIADTATGAYSVVVAGSTNKTVADYSAVVGGRLNTVGAFAEYAGIAGGTQNQIVGVGANQHAFYSFIGGGANHLISANTDSASGSAIIAGQADTILNTSTSFIGGSSLALISTPGQRSNVILGSRQASITGSATVSGIYSTETGSISGRAKNSVIMATGSGEIAPSPADSVVAGALLSSRSARLEAGEAISVIAGTVDTIATPGNGSNAIAASDNSSIRGNTSVSFVGGSNTSSINGTVGVVRASAIIGSVSSTVVGRADTTSNVALVATTSSLVSGDQNAILAGVQDTIAPDAGANNVILGGQNNRITSGADRSAIVAGQNNRITNSDNAVVVGGSNITINGADNALAFNGGVNAMTVTTPSTFNIQDAAIYLRNTDNTARTIRFYEPSGGGTNFTAIRAQAQSADLTYTLPAAAPAANNVALVSSTTGTWTWTANPILTTGYRGRVAAVAPGPAPFNQVIANVNVTADAIILVTYESPAAGGNIAVFVSARNAGADFTVTFAAAPPANSFVNYTIIPQ